MLDDGIRFVEVDVPNSLVQARLSTGVFLADP
jgi:hypothetical protein